MKKKVIISVITLLCIYALSCIIFKIKDADYLPSDGFGKSSYIYNYECSKVFRNIKEPNMYIGKNLFWTNSIRFTYMPSFQNYFIVRIDLNTGVLYYKVYDRHKAASIKSLKVNLNPTEISEIKENISKSNLWQIQPLSRRLYLDGEAWLFECIQNGKYHAVIRHTGEDKNLNELGLLLSKLTREKPFEDIAPQNK